MFTICTLYILQLHCRLYYIHESGVESSWMYTAVFICCVCVIVVFYCVPVDIVLFWAVCLCYFEQCVCVCFVIVVMYSCVVCYCVLVLFLAVCLCCFVLWHPWLSPPLLNCHCQINCPLLLPLSRFQLHVSWYSYFLLPHNTFWGKTFFSYARSSTV